MTFGKRLRDLRQERGLGLRTLAATVKMDYALLSKIEKDLRPAPDVALLFALLDRLEVREACVIREVLELAAETQPKPRYAWVTQFSKSDALHALVSSQLDVMLARPKPAPVAERQTATQKGGSSMVELSPDEQAVIEQIRQIDHGKVEISIKNKKITCIGEHQTHLPPSCDAATKS